MQINRQRQSTATWLPTEPVRWELSSTSPAYQDEGSKVNIRLRIFNPVPGATVEIQVTGALAGDDDWEEKWDNAVAQACGLRRCTYTRIGNAHGTITIGTLYDGRPIDINRTSKLDERTEGTQQLDCFIRNQSQGVIKRGVVSRWLYDVSLTPPGTPTFRMRSLTPGSGIDEGDSFTVRIETENMIPGTFIRIYAANTASGQADWTEAFRTMLQPAVLAADCLYSTNINPWTDGNGINWPGTGGLNGLIILFPATYSDANPIEFTWTALADSTTEAAQEQVDIIVDNISNEDDMIVYAKVVSKWIRDTSRSPTPSYWEIEMTPPRPMPGDTVTYRLFSTTGVSAASVTLTEGVDALSGDWVEGFHAAITAAADADPHVSHDGAGTVTVDAGWSGSFSWTRTVAAGMTGQRRSTVRLSGPTSTSRIVVADAVAFLGGVTLAAEPQYVTGVNLAGAEFNGDATPGLYGNDYRYPARPEFNTPPAGVALDDYRHQEIWYWYLKNAKVIRVPFLWERIQRSLGADLYDGGFAGTWGGGTGHNYDMARLDDIIRYATERGIAVVLDLHNYGKYRIVGVSNTIINPETSPTPEHFYDVWEKLANRYKANPLVWFGIMNEPNGINAQEWERYARGCVNAIRARTGALNRILVPGTAFTGAWSWETSGNGDAFRTFFDPADNFDFEMHQYLDGDSAGNDGVCSLSSGFRLNAATRWLRETGNTGFLGEFAFGDPAVAGQEQCSIEGPNIMQAMNSAKDVWRGWTAWGGGMRWTTTYIFRLDPANYVTPTDTALAEILIPYFYDGGD